MQREPTSIGVTAAVVAALAVLALVIVRGDGGPAHGPRPGAAAGVAAERADTTSPRDALPLHPLPAPGEPPGGAGEDAAPEVSRGQAVDREEPESAEAAYWRSADIEDFKREIYAMEIDSVDEIHKLEDLVHVEVEDTRQLWDTDWSGVDDWKRRQNGFTLEQGRDGTLMFVPDQETQRLFTFFEGISLYEYDEANDAFVNEVDYYGKPIFNVVKFLREDVLVMMTISGHKVDLNLYGNGVDGQGGSAFRDGLQP